MDKNNQSRDLSNIMIKKYTNAQLNMDIFVRKSKLIKDKRISSTTLERLVKEGKLVAYQSCDTMDNYVYYLKKNVEPLIESKNDNRKKTMIQRMDEMKEKVEKLEKELKEEKERANDFEMHYNNHRKGVKFLKKWILEKINDNRKKQNLKEFYRVFVDIKRKKMFFVENEEEYLKHEDYYHDLRYSFTSDETPPSE